MNFRDLARRLLEYATRKEFLETIGQFARDRIKTRTRLGYGVAELGAQREKLKPLSGPYKEIRKRLRKAGKLSDLTTPARSNLTKTGRMINSIRHEVKGKTVEVYVLPDQAEKAKANVDLGRPFLNLTDKDLKELKTMAVAQLAKAIKK